MFYLKEFLLRCIGCKKMTMILSSYPGRGLLHIHDGGDNMRARSLRKNVVSENSVKGVQANHLLA